MWQRAEKDKLFWSDNGFLYWRHSIKKFFISYFFCFCLPLYKQGGATNGHHQPYTGHQQHTQQQHVTEEEKMLLEQLKNTNLGAAGPPPGVPQRTNHLNSQNHVNFTVPVTPSPITGRRYQNDDDDLDRNGENVATSMENVHLSVDGAGKRNIKLSSDSGLGSSELVDERQQFQNGKIDLFDNY